MKPYNQILVAIWVFLMVNSNIRSFFGIRYEWFVTALILVPVITYHLLGYGFYKRLRILLGATPKLLLLGPMLLVIGILSTALVSVDAMRNFGESLKLSIIFGVGLTLFSAYPEYCKIAYRATKVAVAVNLILLLIGLMGVTSAASVMGAHRWGTLLAYPGTLWRIGLFVVFVEGYKVFADGRWRSLLWLTSAMSLIILDGSRSGLLVILLWFFISSIWITFRKKGTILLRKPFLRYFFFGILAILIAMSFWTTIETTIPVIQRIEANLVLGEDAGDTGFSEIDNIRTLMLIDAINQIKLHPFIGTGSGSTTLVLHSFNNDKPMVVHNTYLQIWADEGFMAFVGIIVIMIGWTLYFTRIKSRLKWLDQHGEDITLLQGSIFMLIASAITALFHPISTEWSEWVFFIVPYGLFINSTFQNTFFETLRLNSIEREY